MLWDNSIPRSFSFVRPFFRAVGTGQATEYADWQNLSMPSITGYLAPTLTVANLARSVIWYREVLDLNDPP